jgi:hypothetical protein
MEIQGSAIFIPFEYIPVCCGGIIVLVIIGWLYVAFRKATAPRKETVYYGNRFMGQD